MYDNVEIIFKYDIYFNSNGTCVVNDANWATEYYWIKGKNENAVGVIRLILNKIIRLESDFWCQAFMPLP